MSIDVRAIVISHISECEVDGEDGPLLWCSTHNAMKRSDDCVVMMDAIDLAEDVAEALSPARTHPTRGKEYALRLNCEKNGCVEKYGQKHADDGDLRFISESSNFWQRIWNESTINGHACDQVTREVLFGVWTVEP